MRRLRGAPESARTGLIQELVSERFAENSPPATPNEEINLVINSIMSGPVKPGRAEIDAMLATVRNHLSRATDPEKIAVVHRCVCRLRDL